MTNGSSGDTPDLQRHASEPLTGDTDEFIVDLFGIGRQADDSPWREPMAFGINREVARVKRKPRRSFVARVASAIASLFGAGR